ncbi:His/Gly/Thr/Pro-type tRNA ligase C-terminal domain-containing protein [Fodinicola feengrottensis]|uniref:His/Gly/Thr/Pro-type tRNA ligase C-terminal domain-containing protein n=1 Tax=Fodinicola feengrottensis TaxID=435914 RepID=UPI0024411D44|nr:His/Gly/Thr/Pro-type tRNA ligase C-terminal domain-containing protein [Fodinicola feengrottensis]
MVVKAGDGVAEAAEQLVDDLRAAGVRVALDDRVDTAFGRRAVDAELKGVPVRIEVGPRDLADQKVTLVRRIAGSKTPTELTAVVTAAKAALAEDQDVLYSEALERREKSTVDVATVADAAEAAKNWLGPDPVVDVGRGGRGGTREGRGQREGADPARWRCAGRAGRGRPHRVGRSVVLGRVSSSQAARAEPKRPLPAPGDHPHTTTV